MSEIQNDRFKYINNDDPVEGDKQSKSKNKNKFAQFNLDSSVIGISGGLGWKAHYQLSLANSRTKVEEVDEQQRQKDRKIKKLTNINKHLLEQLKQQNDELTKRVEKQKFRIPKKSLPKSQSRSQQVLKQSQGIKRQMQNAYNQIESYKETISLLKAKQMLTSQQDKLIDGKEKLRHRNEEIQKIQQQIKTQRTIKSHQDKQLGKIKNDQMTEAINQLNEEIRSSKIKLKEVKKNLSKREQLQKKQHMYFGQLEILVKKSKITKDQFEQQAVKQQGKLLIIQVEITQLQWKKIKEQLHEQKKKYEQYGKKLTYHNYMKSKQAKILEEMQLKYKEKAKILQKLKSKLNQVDKLSRLRPKPEMMEKVNLKMEKLKDIISRQSHIQMDNSNKLKSRVQSEDTRQFKKWELEHASRMNNLQEKSEIIKRQYESDKAQTPRNEFDFPLNTSKEEIKV